MSALRSLRRTEQEIVFRPWIYEIAKNACIDHLRRARRAQEVSIDSDDFGPGEESRLSQAATGTDAAVARRSELESLRMAFHDLPPTQHEILVMRELEGLSYDSIGNRMGLTRGAVESLLFRARRRLRDGFDEIDTGARCESMRAAMEGVADGSARARERRRLSSHLHTASHAGAMRRPGPRLPGARPRGEPRAPGGSPRGVLPAAAALPAPPAGDAAGGLGPAAQAGMEQGATLAGKATARDRRRGRRRRRRRSGAQGFRRRAAARGRDLPWSATRAARAAARAARGTATPAVAAAGGAAGGGQGAGGAAGRPGRRGRQCRHPAGPNGPAGGGNSALPGGLGGPLDAAAPGAGARDRRGRPSRADDSGVRRRGPYRRVRGRRRGRVAGQDAWTARQRRPEGCDQGVTKDVGDTVKNVPQTVQDAPKTVKEVTKTLPEAAGQGAAGGQAPRRWLGEHGRGRQDRPVGDASQDEAAAAQRCRRCSCRRSPRTGSRPGSGSSGQLPAAQ